MYELILVYSYLAIGIYCICNNYNIDQNYMILLIFFLLKTLFDYRKCTVSYLETKLRSVKKKDGYLFALMDDILNIRNNQCYRNLIGEVCFIICNSLKTKSLTFMKIKDTDFNIHYLESKIQANKPDLINDKLKYGDPSETKIILNEFNYCLINKKYELCVYWLSWIFEWEKKNTKKNKMYVCGYREITNIDNKYYNDLVWLIWEIILKEGVKTNHDFLNNQIHPSL